MVLRNQPPFWKFPQPGPHPRGQALSTHRVSGFSFLSWETRLPSLSLEHKADQG